MKIKQDVLDVLIQSTTDGNILYLPSIQLERKLYTDVNKCLESIGGSWNRKLKGHLFKTDSSDLLDDMINTGEFIDKKKEYQFFETPVELSERLVELAEIRTTDVCLEPSGGKGKIVNRLEYHGISCVGTDLSSHIPVNFLTEYPYFNFSHIITNPPFSLKAKFYKRCLESGLPFALLIPFDFNGWLCEAFDKYDCQGLVPNRRINFITPSGKSEETGNTANFHSFWLTRFFNLPKQLTIVDLPLESKKNV